MKKRIYYHDTDAGGVVYYANYLKYLEEARTEYLIERGLTIEYLKQERFLYAVRKCSLVYKAPARYGDMIVIDAQLQKITAAQIMFKQSVIDAATSKLLVEADVTLVSLDYDFKPAPIPEQIRQALLS
ncbi:MAG: YbgC/FadM family acyl-CoA thioesterase [Candidatus Omnitrophica bacterium]|nr:YbgC/FadM family acyl-CoA thioesterase [Candidatus Omnitrophota bacterium]